MRRRHPVLDQRTDVRGRQYPVHADRHAARRRDDVHVDRPRRLELRRVATCDDHPGNDRHQDLYGRQRIGDRSAPNFTVTVTTGPVPSGCTLSANPSSGSAATQRHADRDLHVRHGSDRHRLDRHRRDRRSCPTHDQRRHARAVHGQQRRGDHDVDGQLLERVPAPRRTTRAPRRSRTTPAAAATSPVARRTRSRSTNQWGQPIDLLERLRRPTSCRSSSRCRPALRTAPAIKTSSWVEYGDGACIAKRRSRAWRATSPAAMRSRRGPRPVRCRHRPDRWVSFQYKVGSAGHHQHGGPDAGPDLLHQHPQRVLRWDGHVLQLGRHLQHARELAGSELTHGSIL